MGGGQKMKRLLLIHVFILLLPMNILAFEVNVHEKITEKSIALSNIEQYLSNNLNIIASQFLIIVLNKEYT